MLYSGQERHGCCLSLVRGWNPRKIFFAPRYAYKKFHPLSISGCFNCDDPGHALKQCKVPLNVGKATAPGLEYYEKSQSRIGNNHLVLAEICYQLDISGGNAIIESEEDIPGQEALSEKDTFLTILEYVKDNVYVHMNNVDAVTYSDSDTDDGNDGKPCVIDAFGSLSSTHQVEGTTFKGICIDNDAQRSVVLVNQA